MAGIFSGFAIFGALGNTIMNVLKWVGIALVIIVPLGALAFFMIKKAKEKSVMEINMVNRRIKNFVAIEKKNNAGRFQLWLGQLKKFMPKVQSEDTYLKGRTDTIIILKDNNGLHHTARIPTLEELRIWYKVVYNIDLDQDAEKLKQEYEEMVTANPEGISSGYKDRFGRVTKESALAVLGTVYLLPNPAEDVNWLADQCREADKMFAMGMMKNPMMVWIGTLAILAFLTIIWLIIMKKM